jgi:hypothetical protein
MPPQTLAVCQEIRMEPGGRDKGALVGASDMARPARRGAQRQFRRNARVVGRRRSLDRMQTHGRRGVTDRATTLRRRVTGETMSK